MGNVCYFVGVFFLFAGGAQGLNFGHITNLLVFVKKKEDAQVTFRTRLLAIAII